MALAHSSNVVTNGLVFYYDMENTQKSRRGVTTTNQVSDSMSIYNNVPGDVTASLVATTEYYRGAQVWQLTLTPTTANGVGHLSNGANPGIGVISGGGGGLANRFTGHAIFYRSTVPLHSTPLFTNYSNISGWGAGALGSNRSVSMGDGWSRGEVLFFSTSTLSDGKFWAINPATATLNVPIVIFWAGPFKEDRNDSVHVAAYTPSTRSNTQSILDLTGNNTITTNSLTYATDGTFRFNGSTDFISTNYVGNTSSFTHEVFLRPTNVSKDQMYIGYGAIPANYVRIVNSRAYVSVSVVSGQQIHHDPQILANNTNYHIVSSYNGSQLKIYVNGVLSSSTINSPLTGWGVDRIGRWLDADQRAFEGTIFNLKTYNRELSELEVQQNFNALRGRYGI